MNWARWHKWFSAFYAVVAAIHSVLQWLHDWGEDE